MKRRLMALAAALWGAAGVTAAWQTAYPAEAATEFVTLTHGGTPYLYCDRLLWAGDSATVMTDFAADAGASGTVLAVGSSNDTDNAHELYAKNRICLTLEAGRYVLSVRGTKAGEGAVSRPGRRTVALTMARGTDHVTAFRVLEDGTEVLTASATLEGGGVNSLCFGSDFGASAASGVTVLGAQACRGEGSLTAGIPADGELTLIGVSPDWRALEDPTAFAVRQHAGTDFYDAGASMIYADCSGAVAFEATAEDGAFGTALALGNTNTDSHALSDNNRIVVSVADGRYRLTVRGAAGTAGKTAVSDESVLAGRQGCLLTVARTSGQSVTARLFVGGVLQCEAVQTVTAGPINAVCVGSDFGSDEAAGVVVGNGVVRWGPGGSAGLASVPDAEAALRGPFEFTVENGVATVSGYRGAGVGAVTVPDTVPDSGEPVVALADRLFYGRSGLTAVTLPASLTTVGAEAFSGCMALAEINLPGSVSSIGDEAFLKCFGLTLGALPESLEALGAQAFGWCQGLTGGLVLPASLTALGPGAFVGCTGLTAVSGGTGLDEVPAGAFAGCTGLVSVALPSVTAVGRQAFQGCTGLTEASLPAAVTVGRQAFHGCRSLGMAELSPAVEPPAYGAFDRCPGLPADGAGFRYLDASRRVLLALPATAAGGTVRVPDGVTAVHSGAFGPASAVGTVVLPASLTTVGEEAFYGCRGARFRFLGQTPPESVGPLAFPSVTGDPAVWTLPGVPTGEYPRGASAWEALPAGEPWHGLTLSPFAFGFIFRLR